MDKRQKSDLNFVAVALYFILTIGGIFSLAFWGCSTNVGSKSYQVPTVNVNAHGGLIGALSFFGSSNVNLVISDNQVTTGSSVSIPGNINLIMYLGGRITGDATTGTSIYFEGPFDAGLYQVFAADSSVTPVFHNGVKCVYPQWWGENGLASAVTASGSSPWNLAILDTQNILSSLTIPSNITTIVSGNGKFDVNSGVTLTINGPFIELGAGTKFDGDGWALPYGAILYRDGERFLHNFQLAGTNGGNLFLGKEAGNFTTTGSVGSEGSGNVGLGEHALKSLTTGYHNTAVGYLAGAAATTSTSTALGRGALYANTTGTNNVAVGINTLYNLNPATLFATEGTNNTAIGGQALFSGVSAHNNVAIGSQALYSGVSAFYNTAVGVDTLYANETGTNNVAVGIQSLWANTVSNNNTALGSYALNNKNDVSGENTAVGYLAGYETTSGYHNTFVGMGAGYENTTGTDNIALGMYALYGNTVSANSIAIGNDALYTSDAGAGNTGNIAIGRSTMSALTTGTLNTAIGDSVLTGVTDANYSTGVGRLSLSGLRNGSSNTALGANSGIKITSGDNNTFIGYQAGDNASQLTVVSNSMALGYLSYTTADNHVRIGNSSVTQIGGETAWTTISDVKTKFDIEEDYLGLAFIVDLSPKKYKKYRKVKKDDKIVIEETPGNEKTTGLVAQDVKAVMDAQGVSFSGWVPADTPDGEQALTYSAFIMPLINAVKELKAEIDALKARVEELESK